MYQIIEIALRYKSDHLVVIATQFQTTPTPMSAPRMPNLLFPGGFEKPGPPKPPTSSSSPFSLPRPQPPQPPPHISPDTIPASTRAVSHHPNTSNSYF